VVISAAFIAASELTQVIITFLRDLPQTAVLQDKWLRLRRASLPLSLPQRLR
jgi:hypothetical protein